MNTRRALLITTALVVGLAASGLRPGPAAEVGAAPASNAPAENGAARASGPSAEASPSPLGPGWSRWAGWGEACPLWLAGGDSLPAPPRWEACEGFSPELACRRMTTDWPHGTGTALGVTPRLKVEGGKATLAFNRLAIEGSGSARSYKQWLVADVDGPTRFALGLPYAGDPGCTLVEQPFGGGTAAFAVRGEGGSDTASSKVDGALIVDLASREMRVAFRNDDDEVSSWSAWGPTLVRAIAPARRAELTSGGAARALHDPDRDPEGLPLAGNAPLVGERGEVFFEVGRGLRRALHAFDPATGSRPLVRPPAGDGKGAGNAATDGRDLVWVQGEGDDERGRYQRAFIMASPHTTDPSRLKPHRIAPTPNTSIGTSPLAIGCGRVAQWAPEGLLIVRLRDGASRLLKAPEGRKWGQPLGLTCDELFVTYFEAQATNIARLSALP